MSDFAYKKVHMIGIGGISMSGIAKILIKMGVKISGSDARMSDDIDELIKLGAVIGIGHNSKNIPQDTELVVMTAAIEKDNPELLMAINKDIPVWRRSQLIGWLMREKIGVCVAGMHGKSTTSSIIAQLLYEMGEDPTILVGAKIKSLATNSRFGQGDVVVAEACEYNRSFLDFEPTIAVILNVEEEHLDSYRDLNDILDSFKLFCRKVPDNGVLIGCLDDENVKNLFAEIDKIKIGYGFKDKPDDFNGVYWQIQNFQKKEGKSCWQVSIDGEKDDIVYELSLPGEFNVLNATAALAVADFLVLDMREVANKLKNITGSVRRFDILGEKEGVIVIDDYGHHPTEIRNAIKAVKDFYPDRKLWVVFWPHQYNRTEQFFDGFIECFDQADEIVVLDVYEARVCDTDKSKYNSKIMVEEIAKRGKKVKYIKDYQLAFKYIKENIEKGSVLLTQGAGPIDQLARLFMDQNK